MAANGAWKVAPERKDRPMEFGPGRVEEVFLAAIEQENPADRAAVLDRECTADDELRRRVEALLIAHDRPARVLDRPLRRTWRASPDDRGRISRQRIHRLRISTARGGIADLLSVTSNLRGRRFVMRKGRDDLRAARFAYQSRPKIFRGSNCASSRGDHERPGGLDRTCDQGLRRSSLHQPGEDGRTERNFPSGISEQGSGGSSVLTRIS